MKRYNPSDIEPKWQKIWADDQRYHAKDDAANKYYISAMFPYPSAAGMHVGHTFEHAIVDAIARFQRAHGANVLNPMGWDSFGLPAENYAIKTGTPPAQSTTTNIAGFTNQLKRLGASIDWSREINTSDPEYYTWTQWIFTQLFERGLAYQKDAQQWWCPVDMTVLANEQVENGKCWRCGSDVEKKAMKQWFFKITDYADALLEEIDGLDWPDKIKTAQTNWIGRSHGTNIRWQVTDENGVSTSENFEVYTTRTDTLPGVTFIVVAPESSELSRLTTDNEQEKVETYRQNVIRQTEVERQENKQKTGVPTGKYAKNPLTGAIVPIYVADYVLAGYGTGIVMGMPGHDQRDRDFATAFKLPIIETSTPPENTQFEGIWTGKDGTQINSGDQYDGRPNPEVATMIQQELIAQNVGEASVRYKMRDWLISRQRYWGVPIPIIHCDEHGAVAVPADDLPVLLPEVDEYEPKGESVLASQTDWVATTCPSCGKSAKRETDTMDGYACSSWYLLRYIDPHNERQAWDPKLANYWTPLDMYVGGDHAVAHLLYVRFWNHVFYDMGLVPSKEPVKKLVYHGLIGAEDGRKMSKSLGNVVDPLEVIDQGYGADALRTFELFLGPINENSQWSSRGIAGVYRFLNRAWTLTQEFIEADASAGAVNAQLIALQHQTTKKVTEDINRLSFNTAIAALMEYVNELYKLKTAGFTAEWRQPLETLVQLLAVFAPHASAELWSQLGNGDQLDTATWPTWNEQLTMTDTMTIVVQVNGRVRAKLNVAKDTTEGVVKEQALVDENVQKFVGKSKPAKIIYIPGRLVNIVVAR